MRYQVLVLVTAASVGLLGASAVACADEVTTTTTTRTDGGPAPGVTVGVPGVVGVTVGGGVRSREGCETKKATRTNEDTGATVTRTQTNCD